MGSAALFITIGMVFVLVRTDFYKYYSSKDRIHDEVDETDMKENGKSNLISKDVPKSIGMSGSPNTTEEVKVEHHNSHSWSEILLVHNQMAMLGWGVCVIYIQTFFVFPGVLLQGGISFIGNPSWSVWFVITLFNIMDMISRFVTEKYVVLTEKTTVIATA